MWTSRVERTVSAAHHNGPLGGKCATNHGHDWHIVVEFTYEDLDSAYGWGPDFGIVKKTLDEYDHQDLNTLMPVPSAELFARHLFEELADATGCVPDFVQVSEGHGNKVTYRD